MDSAAPVCGVFRVRRCGFRAFICSSPLPVLTFAAAAAAHVAFSKLKASFLQGKKVDLEIL